MEKIEVIKRAEKYTFSKGVSPWSSSKNRTFSYRCFFTEIMSEEIVFGYFGKKTIIFRPKIEVLTMAKKCTFFREVSPWILSKNRTFSYRRFLQKLYQKRSFLILWKEKNDFKRKNRSFKKGQKLTFSKWVSPWMLFKNRSFSDRCFLQKLCQERSFLDILNRKQSF